MKSIKYKLYFQTFACNTNLQHVCFKVNEVKSQFLIYGRKYILCEKILFLTKLVSKLIFEQTTGLSF